VKGSVLHLHWTFPPTTGGVESHLSDLARLQARDGWEVTVLTGEAEPLRRAGYEVISTPLLDLDLARGSAHAPGSHLDQLADLLTDLVRSRRVSVVHGHNLHHFSPAPALAVDLIRISLGVAVHHTFHETWPDVLTRTPVYRGWDGNYAISNFVADQCEARIGFRPEVFHLGVDTARLTARRTPFTGAGPTRILHPARLLPWKGVHISLRALRLLLDDGWDVELVLTDAKRIADWDRALPDYRQSLVELMQDLALESRVRLMSARFDEMPTLYDAADIVLYPTVKDEPFGLVPPEAMSCARPVVASRSGGISETVVDGVTGYLVAPDDARGLADRIADLLADPKAAQRMGRAGRRHVRRHFDASKYVAALGQRYLGGPAAQPS
jgi:glycosyltransferase involved in cell wall biosynthesis